jgi:hypothetical protein
VIRRPIFALLALATVFAGGQPRVRAQAPPPATGPSRDASMDEYRSHLQALTAVVEACAKTRDTKTCDPALVGPDDRVSLAGASDRRTVRYGWLRALLAKAQLLDEPPAKPPANGPNRVPSPTFTQPLRRATSQLLQDAEARLAADRKRIDAAPQPIPAHPQERQTMSKVLAGREYRNIKEPGELDKAWEKFGNFLDRFLILLAGSFGAARWLGRAIVWGLVVAACVGLVWALLQVERRWRMRLVPELDRPAPGAASARDWQLWREDASCAAATGQWREAIRLLYWASISRLESLRLWPADRARTPREYLALVAAEDPRKAGLTALTGSFERIWYGGRGAAESDYRQAERLASALIAGSGSSPLQPQGGTAQ